MNGYIDYLEYKDNIAVIDSKGGIYTYSDLLLNIQTFQKELNPGLAFCFCRNTIGSLVGYLAFLESGCAALMIDANKDVELLKNLANVYTPNYLWLPDELVDRFAGTKSNILFRQLGYTLIHSNTKKLSLFKELTLLLPTSGSTGSPKLVRLNRTNIISNAESIAEYLKINTSERPITSLPMYYSYGLSVINSHLIKGATLLLTDQTVIQKEFWNFAKEQKATSISGVPYTYEMLKRLRFFRMDLPDLTTLTQAGGKLNSSLAKEYIENAVSNGKRFCIMYGQTEATARMSYLPVDKASEKYSSIGIAIPKGHFMLVTPEGAEVREPNIDGELVYSGPNVSMGYAECLEDLTKGDENNGILHTGDIAHRDTDGFYYITGRMKRFIKIYGNRVNLDASEEIVKTITPHCACVGKDDKMIVYVSDQSVCNRVRSYLSEKTGLNNRAFDVRYIPEIPKNGSGKVQYAELNNE